MSSSSTVTPRTGLWKLALPMKLSGLLQPWPGCALPEAQVVPRRRPARSPRSSAATGSRRAFRLIEPARRCGNDLDDQPWLGHQRPVHVERFAGYGEVGDVALGPRLTRDLDARLRSHTAGETALERIAADACELARDVTVPSLRRVHRHKSAVDQLVQPVRLAFVGEPVLDGEQPFPRSRHV